MSTHASIVRVVVNGGVWVVQIWLHDVSLCSQQQEGTGLVFFLSFCCCFFCFGGRGGGFCIICCLQLQKALWNAGFKRTKADSHNQSSDSHQCAASLSRTDHVTQWRQWKRQLFERWKLCTSWQRAMIKNSNRLNFFRQIKTNKNIINCAERKWFESC